MPKPPAQALIEFAITLPILILIAIGIISIGYMLTAQQIITHAAKEGARIGAQTNDNAQINGTIEAIIKSFDSDLTRTKINIDPQDQNSPDRQRGNTLSVEITYEIPFQIPIFSENTLKVNAKSLARIEYE
ncbi:hypothetical protein A2335_02180 [Candidatus Peregrinibacteria bacterium RIFOXYB2_FULL_32_7]|nr:MAG: hypothetical protein A2335_02180 [Candidatus Peregrinibacteria bacterium RIFOXYB2_FULL_32_7]